MEMDYAGSPTPEVLNRVNRFSHRSHINIDRKG